MNDLVTTFFAGTAVQSPPQPPPKNKRAAELACRIELMRLLNTPVSEIVYVSDCDRVCVVSFTPFMACDPTLPVIVGLEMWRDRRYRRDYENVVDILQAGTIGLSLWGIERQTKSIMKASDRMIKIAGNRLSRKELAFYKHHLLDAVTGIAL